MNTRYAALAQDLIAAIARGEIAIGEVLPNEFALAEQFGVSRSTVRAALGELQSLGMVSRKRNVGTTVIAARPTDSAGGFIQTLNTVDAVIQFAANTVRNIQQITPIVADATLADRLQCKPGERWLRISSIRLPFGEGRQQPIAWTDVYVLEPYGSRIAEKAGITSGAFSTLIEEAAGRPVKSIRQTIRAVGVEARMASALQAEPGSHALEITRCYRMAGGELVEVSISVHPADRYTYQSELKRLPGS